MQNPNLKGADLSGTYSVDGHLSGVLLSWNIDRLDKQLIEARSLKGATMPDGTKYEEWIKTHGEDSQEQSQEADEQPIVNDQSTE